MRRLSVVLVLVICCIGAFAQSGKGSNVDPSDLDFGTNLVVPQVPQKYSAAIRTHINNINEALKHLGFNTELNRDKEVLTIIVPCAEMFAPNDTVLKDSYKPKLQHLLKFMQYPTMYKVVIAVYSDNTGEPDYCDVLTAARSNAIDDYLLELAEHSHLSDVNVIPYGMGQSDPRVENNSIVNRGLNRRVEIHIIPEWEMIATAKAGKLNR